MEKHKRKSKLFLKRMQMKLKLLDVDKKVAYLVGRTQQEQSKELNLIDGLTPPLTNEKEHKSSIEMETNLPHPSPNDKPVKLNAPNYTQIIMPPLANEKTHTPIPTKNVSMPTETDNKPQSNGLDPIQTQNENKNKRTNNDVTISTRNKNGNSIIS